ncbi:MAG: CocE/NonD family hydrolase [Sphingomicrobium sp.]
MARCRSLSKVLLLSAAAVAAPAAIAQPVSGTAGASFGHYQPAAEFDGRVSTSFYLPMRDGTRLAVRVDRPARAGKAVEGRFPVVWHHNLSISESPANGTGDQGFRDLPELTRYGYVVVQVARRGNGQSFGVRRGYHERNETEDAYEITQWLAAQPWSTGKVGMYGCSNTGDAGLQALTVRPPALKASFLGCFSWHKYDAFRRGGIFAQWGTGPSRTVEQDVAVSPVQGDEDKKLLRQAAEEHQLSTNLFEMWKQMPFRDSFSTLVGSRFWGESSGANYADQIRRSGVAVYILGGWFDELRDQGVTAHLNIPGSKIIIGPWKHCQNNGFPLFEEIHRFYDQYLKGVDTGITREPAIHYYTLNAAPGTEWRGVDQWPVPGTKATMLTIGGSGPLALSGATGKPFAVNYQIDCPEAKLGPVAQPCHIVGAGPSFTGPSLARDTEVTGSGVADLWIAADGPDANVFAYLEDVGPDGSVRVVTEGRLKASLRKLAKAPWVMPTGVPWHRAYAEDAQPLVAGQPVELKFEIMPTSYVFKAGHRLQLTITGADPRERARDLQGLSKTITILSDAQHPSALTLPVVVRQ